MTQLEPEAGPIDVPAPETEVGTKPPRRIGNIVLTVLTVVILVAAAIAVALGMQARGSADDARAHAVILRHDRRAAESRQQEVEQTMDTVNAAVAKVPTTFDALAQSLGTV